MIERLGDIPGFHSKIRPDEIAFWFEGRTVSYGALEERTDRAAQGLLSLELQPDERIGYLGKNNPEYWEILLAASKAGGVMTPLNWRLALPEIEYIVIDAKIRILFADPDFRETAEKLAAAVPAIQHVIIVNSNDDKDLRYEDWRDSFEAVDPHIARTPDDDALQLYTSGTTGRPKGAVLSHRAILEPRKRDLEEQGPEWTRWSPSDVSLVAMPCFHIGGTGWGISGLYNGAKGVVAREFDPTKVLEFMEQHKISKLFMVPAAMQIVLNQPGVEDVDFSQLKYILYGASPIPLDLLKSCMDVFGCGFVQMYGMTETAGTVVALPPEDHSPEGNPRMRSTGKALDGVEIRILDQDGRVLPPGETGEIAIRSVSNMTRYWQLPEATSETLSADGWLRSGDAGYMDEDGYIYIQDRVKDMIISGGENVYPAEVEDAIYSHPAVAEVGVIGVPDDKWGEAVKACVVLKPGAQADASDLIKWARERIAGYKCPKSVEFIDVLPRNPSGKILRKDLRATYWTGSERNIN